MSTILGIDEVGRGPWAGPLVVGAVVLGPDFQDYSQEASSVPHQPNTETARRQKGMASQACTLSQHHDTPHDSTSSQPDTKYYLWENLADSKQLSAKKRIELNRLILAHAAAHGMGWVSSSEIDRYGLNAALKLAARRAVKQILRQATPFTEIIIDGTINLLDQTPLAERVTLLKKADSLVKEVSAASIIAKVARDQYMVDLAARYPNYGFESHVGYGTAAHRQSLETFGVCPEHRQSFRPIREIASRFSQESSDINRSSNAEEQLSKQDSLLTIPNITKTHTTKLKLGRNNAMLGQTAESAVADYLSQQDHVVLMRNFKTRICEIDLISTKGNEIIFTEVKYHQNIDHGSPLEQIDRRKQAQLKRSVEIFLSLYPQYRKMQPRLAAASVIGPSYRVDEYLFLTE